MVPRSNGVAAMLEPLNHESRSCSQRNIRGIMNASISQRCCGEAFIESRISIIFLKEYSWYNERMDYKNFINKEVIF